MRYAGTLSILANRLIELFLIEHFAVTIWSEPYPLPELGGKRALITVAEVDGNFSDGGVSLLKHLTAKLYATAAEKLFRGEAGVLLKAPVEVSMRHTQFGSEI